MNQSYSKRHQELEEELSSVGGLHFQLENLEDDFVRYFKESNLFRYRIASIIGVVALLVFMIQDLAVFPEASKISYLVIRAGICIPFFIISFSVSLIPNMQRQLPYFMVTGLLLLGLGSVIIVAINYGNNHVSPYEGILLTIIATHFLVGLDFRSATMCSVLIMVSYAFSVMFVYQGSEQAYYNLTFVVATVVVSVAGGFEVEKQQRINFIKNEILTILSQRDGLTGIYNRATLEHKLKSSILSAIREKRGIAVCLMDVDFFKNYNDHYGHIAGDECLRSVAIALQSCCKRSTDFCARYGGEEFALVWIPTRSSAPDCMVNNIQEEIKALKIPHAASTVSDYVSVSGGVVYFSPTRRMSNDDLFQVVDEALYTAKKSGRNQFKVINDFEA